MTRPGAAPELVLRNGLVDVGDGCFERADIGIRDGRIDFVGEGGATACRKVDCSRFLVVPGIVNAHSHSNENWLRGRFDNLPLEPWMLFSYPVLAAPGQTRREIYVRTLLGALEMIRSGATSVVDFLYELPELTDGSLSAVVEAYRDIGMRALIVLGMGDRAYHETVALDLGLVPQDLCAELERETPPAWSDWRQLARSAVARFHRPEEGISIGLGPSGPQRCTDEMLAGCAALAHDLDLVVHIHVLETRMQALSGRRLYGTTLPEHLDEIGFLGERVNFEHAIWLTDHDIDLVASSGTGIVHSPISNMKLGSGISPVPLLLRRGVNVALGSDGMSSNDGNDLYATLKVAGLLHKLWAVDYEEWAGAREAWRIATAGGAQPMANAGVGRLGPGAHADLVLLDLDSLPFTPLNEPVNHIVFSTTRAAVHSTMVGGRWVLRAGETVGVDEGAILAEARELAPAVLARHARAFETAERLVAAVRRGWHEALESELGMTRLLPHEARGRVSACEPAAERCGRGRRSAGR
jgi:5-methylthioadenosine/S-adenosylhomocysteine deaminase